MFAKALGNVLALFFAGEGGRISPCPPTKTGFHLQRVIGRMYRNELSGALSKTVLALTPLNRLTVFIADRCE